MDFSFLTLWGSIIVVAITILFAVLFWVFIYKLFRKETTKAYLVPTIILVILSPLIAIFSFKMYCLIDRTWFGLHANGEIQLAYSEFKVPDQFINNAQRLNYCEQFHDQNGAPIKIITSRYDGYYCGQYWDLPNLVLTVPFQYLNDKQAIYWANPAMQIIAPRPNFLKQAGAIAGEIDD